VALKKSDLYSSLWASCDQLRGGMDASQYKDYILTMLFMKYVSDKAASDADSLIEVPEGGSFDDMFAAKGDPEIGDRFNKIIGRLADANGLRNVIDQADFNDAEKLGNGKEMQDRLSKLVTIFRDLDFRGSRAEGDDLLGDALLARRGPLPAHHVSGGAPRSAVRPWHQSDVPRDGGP
jgi:type I restriction enzyme M protein